VVDDRAVREKLAALEAEVKADADAARVRKEAALARVREERARQQEERDELRHRQAELITRKKLTDGGRRTSRNADDDAVEGVAGALELAGRANRVKQELARKPGQGEKSWIKSGLASMALGPLGWLYAGSLREAIPASVAWIALAAVASRILPVFLLMPVLMIVMPLSGIAGVVYALQYNRSGGRQRLFDKEKDKDKGKGKTPRQLRGGDGG